MDIYGYGCTRAAIMAVDRDRTCARHRPRACARARPVGQSVKRPCSNPPVVSSSAFVVVVELVILVAPPSTAPRTPPQENQISRAIRASGTSECPARVAREFICAAGEGTVSGRDHTAKGNGWRRGATAYRAVGASAAGAAVAGARGGASAVAHDDGLVELSGG